jgi:hypothetical protein
MVERRDAGDAGESAGVREWEAELARKGTWRGCLGRTFQHHRRLLSITTVPQRNCLATREEQQHPVTAIDNLEGSVRGLRSSRRSTCASATLYATHLSRSWAWIASDDGDGECREWC